VSASARARLALLIGLSFVAGCGGAAPPAPSAAATAVLDAPAAMPTAVLGDWHADHVAITGVTAAQLVRLSLDWSDGTGGWIQLDGDGTGRHVFDFTSLAAADGELRLRANEASTCAARSEGRYGWSRSVDGLFLTLTTIQDPCKPRADALARTWVHSLGAITDGGTGVLRWEPWMEVTLPKQKMRSRGGQDAADLTTYGDAQPFRAFAAIKNVGVFGEPCSPIDLKKIDLAHTTAALVTYMRTFPGATVKTSNTAIAGKPVVKLDVSIDPGLKCGTEAAQAFHPALLTDETAWGFAPGEHEVLYAMQFDPTTTILFWYQGPDGEAQGVFDSLKFLDQLPSPTG
jgi:hypothetical protein